MANKTYKIIRLENLSPLHIGTGTENYYTSSSDLQSDVISSALAAVAIQMGILKVAKDSDMIVKEFLESFKISSAFPYRDNSYYLPIASGRIILDDSSYEKKYRKELKNTRFVHARKYFPKWANGEALSKDAVIDNNSTIVKTQVAQRVTVRDYLSTPLFFEWNYYYPNCGLYFILDCEDEIFDNIKKLFSILGEFGIGTDRNIGGGKFTVNEKNITIDLPEVPNPNATLLLSSYIPQKEELGILNLNNSKYTLIKRGGFIAGSNNEHFRHLRKKTIYMFSSGSVFATTENIGGKIEDLMPNNLPPEYKDIHPVYRSGRALTLKIKMQQQ